MDGVTVPYKSLSIEIGCPQVWRELSDYLAADLSPELRRQIEEHLKNCDRCTAVYDGLRNVVRLLGETVIELLEAFSQRLRERLLSIAN